MNEPDYEQLTLFPEGSPASHSVLPGSAEARAMTVTSGRRCLELYRRSGPLGSLVRMCLVSSVWHSTTCFLTWRASVTPHKRLLFRLVPSTPRTDGCVSSYWPTPTATDAKGMDRLLRKDATPTRSMLLSQRVLLTTPTARDFKSPDKNEDSRRPSRKTELPSQVGGLLNPEWVEWLMGFPTGWTGSNASGTQCVHPSSSPSSITSD